MWSYRSYDVGFNCTGVYVLWNGIHQYADTHWFLFLSLYYYNYNYKTSIAPISLKRIELSGAPSTGVWQTHSLDTMQSSSTMIRWQGNLGMISKSEKESFQMLMEINYPIWWLNMFMEWIPKSMVSTWKIMSPSMSLTLGTDNKWKPHERSSLGLRDKESMENRHEGSPEERVW